ncbi:peptidase S8 [Bacillus sp. M6-12]|uniref:S8 family peptidase n=1 Tax=Bacillus sp. M6-12 TaxID=2054166 RepID=UPI000C7602F4|nr:S8 family peptidase [Bacillus sp. M6-12]PLS17926.1 peptidase S8 [Bacillus sp. M6-12]
MLLTTTGSKFLAAALSLSLGMLNITLPVNAESQKESEVIVVYKNQEGREDALDLSKQVDHQFKTVPAVAVTVENKEIDKLENNPDIAYVEENIKFSALKGFTRLLSEKQVKANASSYSFPREESRWNLQAVKAASAWSRGYTGEGVKVAVIDSGIAPHPELEIAGGISTVGYTNSYYDDNGHGTHVAGTIAARRNGSGLVGVAPNAQIYAVKAMDSEGNGYLQDLLEAIDWAIVNKMDILNMSLSLTEDSKLLRSMIDKANNYGILVVAAGGNNGTSEGSGNTVEYPAKYSSAIAVAAVDSRLNRGAFSASGEEIQFSAPGVDVISTFLNGGYAEASGTSMAAPHIAGLLALLKEKYPSKTNGELKEHLKKHTFDLGSAGKDTFYGYGFAFFNTEVENAAQLLAETEKAVALAETSLAMADITDAQSKIDRLADGPEKDRFNQRISTVKNFAAELEKQPKLKFAKNAVEAAEAYRTEPYLKNAQDAVQDLPPGSERDALESRIDTLRSAVSNKTLLDIASKSVADAENFKTKLYAEKAQNAVNSLPDNAEKAVLQNRLKEVQSYLYDKASAMVANAEKSLKKVDVTIAEQAISGIPAGINTTMLQKRLYAVKALILNNAKAKIAAAEKSKKKSLADSAQAAINEVINAGDKTSLQKRLDAVRASILSNAKYKVANAEKYKKKSYLIAAQAAVNELPAGSSRTSLQKKVDAVSRFIQQEAINKVTSAEKNLSQNYVDKAQYAVSELPNGSLKNSLQKRLDVVKKKVAELYKKQVSAAEGKVRQAERIKTNKYKTAAQMAVNGLRTSSQKNAFQKRLNAIKTR